MYNTLEFILINIQHNQNIELTQDNQLTIVVKGLTQKS